MNKRGCHNSPVLTERSIFYSSFVEFDKVYVYPEFVQFFSNVRYLVSLKYKSFAEFSRAFRSEFGIKLTDSCVAGYEKGYHKTAQYNWLVKIARFLGYSAVDMLSVSFRERDERAKDEQK